MSLIKFGQVSVPILHILWFTAVKQDVIRQVLQFFSVGVHEICF